MPAAESAAAPEPRTHESEATGSFAVVALANALLDMSISVKDDYLIHKYGLPCDGQIEVTNQQRALFAEVQENYPVEYVAGGSAQNTVRLVCRLVNARPSCVIGKIARDAIGATLQRLLAQDGVATRYAYDDDEALSSGWCVAIVRPDGSRCLAASVGAAGGFTLDHLERVGGCGAIDRCRVLFVEGFFASHSEQASLAAIRRAHSRPGVVRLLSLSAGYVCSESHAILRQLLPYANLVAGNEDEFRALSDRMGLAESRSDAKAIARRLAGFDYVSPVRSGGALLSDFLKQDQEEQKEQQEHQEQHRDSDRYGGEWDWSRLDERLVLMTRGSAGVLVATASHAWDYAAENVPLDEVRDTTGAGDAFLAGFLSCVVDKRPLDECVARGQRIARLVIAQTGCRLPDAF